MHLNYMDKDLLLVAKDDELGRKLQDLEFTGKKTGDQRRDSYMQKEKKDICVCGFFSLITNEINWYHLCIADEGERVLFI